MTRGLLWLIKAYQGILSPYLPSACRFTPTCSEYTYQAVERYGVLRGLWLGVKRLGRCHPYSSGGFHPVP
jgi:putative membrane protein insertion efficiency factor